MRLFSSILIILFVSINAIGQRLKVSVDQNIGKYEIKDEYNRFDDILIPKDKFENLTFDLISNYQLQITNKYSSGYTGHTIKFKLTKNLELKEATYNYWTDVIDFENFRTYKVKKADLKLSNNPFNELKGFRGNYILEIEHYVNDTLIKSEKFKGKFKTFEGVDKDSEDYKWTLEQNKIWRGITNENGVYLNPDIRPKLRSNIKDLVLKIKELSDLKIPEFRVWLVITEDGKIEKESIRFSSAIYNEKLKSSITDILFEKMDFYPGCVNEKAVKSKVPMRIRLE